MVERAAAVVVVVQVEQAGQGQQNPVPVVFPVPMAAPRLEAHTRMAWPVLPGRWRAARMAPVAAGQAEQVRPLPGSVPVAGQ